MTPWAAGQVEEEADDTERFARMTPEERLALFLELCDLTDSVQAARPDPAALRAAQPLSEASAELWSRLMQRGIDG